MSSPAFCYLAIEYDDDHRYYRLLFQTWMELVGKPVGLGFLVSAFTSYCILTDCWLASVLEGLATIVVGIASFFVIQDFPDTAKFLTEAERTAVIRRLQEDDQFSAAGEPLRWKYILQSLSDWKTWLGSVCQLDIPCLFSKSLTCIFEQWLCMHPVMPPCLLFHCSYLVSSTRWVNLNLNHRAGQANHRLSSVRRFAKSTEESYSCLQQGSRPLRLIFWPFRFMFSLARLLVSSVSVQIGMDTGGTSTLPSFA